MPRTDEAPCGAFSVSAPGQHIRAAHDHAVGSEDYRPFRVEIGVDAAEVVKEARDVHGLAYVPVSYTHLDVYKRQEDASAGVDAGSREGESAADAQAPAAKRRVSGRIAALLCALSLIAALALLIPGQHKAGTSQPQELASFKLDVLFEDAVTVSSDTELAFALADSTVAAVILEGSGANVGLPGTVTELDKPLLISEGARLVMPGALILREGGVLWTAGELADNGTIVAAGGSLVTVDGGALNASVYLLSGGGLLQDVGSVNGEVRDMQLAGGEAVTV